MIAPPFGRRDGHFLRHVSRFGVEETVRTAAAVLSTGGIPRSFLEVLHIHQVEINGSFILFQSLHLAVAFAAIALRRERLP